MANELRVRGNGAAGTLLADITTGTATLSSDGLADLPTIGSTQYAALTLYSRDATGAITFEVVHVTAHTAAATTATVVRGREGSTAAAWVIGDTWSHGPTVADLDGDTAWVTPSLSGTWVSFDAGAVFAVPSYRKDGAGRVHLRGLGKSGTINTLLFTLPAGYRPSKQQSFAVLASADVLGRLDVKADGTVLPVSGSPTTYFSIDGVSFLAEA